jgi:hypothetical protein
VIQKKTTMVIHTAILSTCRYSSSTQIETSTCMHAASDWPVDAESNARKSRKETIAPKSFQTTTTTKHKSRWIKSLLRRQLRCVCVVHSDDRSSNSNAKCLPDKILVGQLWLRLICWPKTVLMLFRCAVPPRPWIAPAMRGEAGAGGWSHFLILFFLTVSSVRIIFFVPSVCRICLTHIHICFDNSYNSFGMYTCFVLVVRRICSKHINICSGAAHMICSVHTILFCSDSL